MNICQWREALQEESSYNDGGKMLLILDSEVQQSVPLLHLLGMLKDAMCDGDMGQGGPYKQWENWGGGMCNDPVSWNQQYPGWLITSEVAYHLWNIAHGPFTFTHIYLLGQRNKGRMMPNQMYQSTVGQTAARDKWLHLLNLNNFTPTTPRAIATEKLMAKWHKRKWRNMTSRSSWW